MGGKVDKGLVFLFLYYKTLLGFIFSFIPNSITVNEFQVLLTSITCLPSYPIGRRYLPYSSPTQYMCLIQSANDPQDPYPALYTQGIKMNQGPVLSVGSP